MPSHHLGLKRYFRSPIGRKYSIELSLLAPFLSITMTYLLFPVAFSSSRYSPDIVFAPSSLALGRCFRIWVLITYQFYCPSLFLCYSAPTNVTLPSIFRKLVGMTFYFDSHCPFAEEYSSLSLFSAAALFTSLTLIAA